MSGTATSVVASVAATETTEEIATEWRLIAELSKSESLDIFQLEMAYFDQKTQTIVKSASGYLSYPKKHLHKLFDTSGLLKLLAKFKIDVSSYVQNLQKAAKEEVGKGKNKKKTTFTADEIRQNTTLELAKGELERLVAASFSLPGFRSNVIEVVLLFFCVNTINAYKKKLDLFLDSLISFRDSLLYFEPSLQQNEIFEFFQKIFYFFASKENMPLKQFLEKHTRLLIRNSFRNNYQRAISLFTEQKQLLDKMKENPCSLFLLPWGVGVGKTALLPAIATVYARIRHHTIYCVPKGPVRDQNAAFLYRCGIPFVYIAPSEKDGFEWELRPSFHCSYGVQPIAFIVDPEFLVYYLRYLAYLETTAEMEERALPPSIHLPQHKDRYKHLSHANLWNPQIALILDEPSETDERLQIILHSLPRIVFVMSATSCSLVDDSVKELYTRKYGEEIVEIQAVNVGVSTTLVAYWLPEKPVLSPFSGVRTKSDFVKVLRKVTSSVIWRRFLSPRVLLVWEKTLRQSDEFKSCMSLEFDFLRLNFEHISQRVIEWAHVLASSDMPDSFFEEKFEIGRIDTSEAEAEAVPAANQIPNKISKILREDSHLFLRGCIIGTQSTEKFYNIIEPLLKTNSLATIETLVETVANHKKSIVQQLVEITKGTLATKEEAEERREVVTEILNSKLSVIPLSPQEIINTKEYIKLHNPSVVFTHDHNGAFIRPMELEEIGNPQENLLQWDLFVKRMPKIPDSHAMWRLKALGSVALTKEFYIHNILDLERNMLAFLVVDETGAYGLNIKVLNAVLIDDLQLGYESLLPRNMYFQIAGRVGRQSQDETGYVYVTSQALFDYLFFLE